MLYFLDTANHKRIRDAFDVYPLDGVTTNPTIIAREKTDFLGVLKGIREIIGPDAMLHVQAVGRTAETIAEEARYLNRELGGKLYIKVPVIPEGIRAIKILSAEGVNTTATAVFTAEQALLAAKAGADFIAPYVNRLDDIGGNGVEVVAQIAAEFSALNIEAKVLAAGFKNVQQVHDVVLAGSRSITVNPDLMDQMMTHPLTNRSVDRFISDWEGVYGQGSTTLDVK